MYSCNYIKNSISFRTALLSDCWLLTNPSKIPFSPNQLSKMSCFLLFTELKRRQVALMPHCPTGTSRPALGGGEASAVVGAACEDDICILEVSPLYTSKLGLAINEIYLVVIFNPWPISIANTVTSLSYIWSGSSHSKQNIKWSPSSITGTTSQTTRRRRNHLFIVLLIWGITCTSPCMYKKVIFITSG